MRAQPAQTLHCRVVHRYLCIPPCPGPNVLSCAVPQPLPTCSVCTSALISQVPSPNFSQHHQQCYPVPQPFKLPSVLCSVVPQPQPPRPPPVACAVLPAGHPVAPPRPSRAAAEGGPPRAQAGAAGLGAQPPTHGTAQHSTTQHSTRSTAQHLSQGRLYQ